MTIFARAASFAAMTLFTVGLVVSTPGFAAPAAAVSVPSVSSIDVQPAIPARLPTPTVQADAIVPDAADVIVTNPPAPGYATLAEAVAAETTPDATSDDLSCLAGAVYFESQGEPLAGQLAVANVIINRAKSGRFASSICSVITQHGQFSFVRDGRIPAIDEDRPAYRTAMAVAKIALADAWDSPAPSALFFHARSAGMGRGMTRVAAIGNHVFYR